MAKITPTKNPDRLGIEPISVRNGAKALLLSSFDENRSFPSAIHDRAESRNADRYLRVPRGSLPSSGIYTHGGDTITISDPSKDALTVPTVQNGLIFDFTSGAAVEDAPLDGISVARMRSNNHKERHEGRHSPFPYAHDAHLQLKTHPSARYPASKDIVDLLGERVAIHNRALSYLLSAAVVFAIAFYAATKV
ncbi:hypothetical protein JZX87_14070 [Agrobacterium sp. Ap1]|uniref:hypothetical protein n=1 Tax=Agrobacterium sp. Ap1 TaxID=2815337 RepID=UPI001A8EE6CB|nr:hypothetical protein [Agrobacterium sp. Ap1]MBO0142289.1 hypothetical protein [Agrobacterium sp. Ap1]